MYNFIIFGFMAFMATFAPFCDGNSFITKGLYSIVLLILIALNANDIIEAITKDDDTSSDEIIENQDYIEVGAGIVSTLLFIRAAYTRECSIYYIFIIIFVPVILVVTLIVLDYSTDFLGWSGFSSMDYLPSGIKKLNDIIDIIPQPKNEKEKGPEGDISESESLVKRSQSAADNISKYSESITDNSKTITKDIRNVVSSAVSQDTITDFKENAAISAAKKNISAGQELKSDELLNLIKK